MVKTMVKAETDFENIVEKMSRKHCVILEIWAAKVFEKCSCPDFGIVTIPNKKVLSSNII